MIPGTIRAEMKNFEATSGDVQTIENPSIPADAPNNFSIKFAGMVLRGNRNSFELMILLLDSAEVTKQGRAVLRRLAGSSLAI